MLYRSMNVKFSDEIGSIVSEKVVDELLMAIADEGKQYSNITSLIEALKDAVRTRNSSALSLALSQVPRNCATEHEAYLHFQAIALFKKRDDLDMGIDKQKVALDAFILSERLCLITNRNLNYDTRDAKYASRAVLIHELQRKISDILGPCPELSDIAGRFGPGSNVGCSKYTSVRYKLSADATTTLDLHRLLDEKGITFHAWDRFSMRTPVSGSRWTSVPKTWKTDRGINVEPLVNSFFQAGYGRAIRHRLKRVGVDLRDQSVNQQLALRGSRDGDLATIDLTMASDLIAYNLVRDLLPFEWFSILDVLRSPCITMPDGTVRTLQKFSAMGNGFTFELEALIFYAVLAVCSPHGVKSVYGDDLICEVDVYDRVIESLRLLGFIPNADKSYANGPFRESCGKDYWAGTDVRPLFLTGKIEYADLFRIYNFSVRTGRLAAWRKVALRHVPTHMRLFGPDGFGDGHMIWIKLPRSLVDKRGYSPFYQFKTYSAKTRKVKKLSGCEYSAFLYHSSLDIEERLAFDQGMFSERNRPGQRLTYKRQNIRVPVELCTLCNQI